MELVRLKKEDKNGTNEKEPENDEKEDEEKGHSYNKYN